MLSAARKKQIKIFLKKINVETADEALIDEALTHPSYNFEANKKLMPDYERLEFLGDSVVRLLVSSFLFEKYKDFDEGKLTKIRSYLVSDNFLSKIAFSYKLDELLNIGIHEEKDGGRKKESIAACAMEAVFGAIFRSCGFEITKSFIYQIFENTEFNTSDILYSYNSKELLQQYTQSINKDLPEYQLINETGKSHNKFYEVVVNYHGEELGKGSGKTKKEAEKQAAFNALKNKKVIEG